ncbi:MAG TPA: winged helix-turn-helix domain-containing protein, partial [Candidatus Limnocylindrales bacterium]
AGIDDEALVVALLDAGADDVIGRPARRLELVARVNAAARRRPRPVVPPRSLDGLVVDVDRHRATIEGHDLALTPTELELLATLAAHGGAIVDHRSLIRAIWPDDPTVDHDVLRTHLGRLNAKLISEGHPGLRNVRGRGYGLRVAGGALDVGAPTRRDSDPTAATPAAEATVADRAG